MEKEEEEEVWKRGGGEVCSQGNFQHGQDLAVAAVEGDEGIVVVRIQVALSEQEWWS